jgi:pimeloyl-ACP methyl ester carboxylesterase
MVKYLNKMKFLWCMSVDGFSVKGKGKLPADQFDVTLEGSLEVSVNVSDHYKDHNNLIWLHGFNSRHEVVSSKPDFPGVEIYVQELMRLVNEGKVPLNVSTFTYSSHKDEKTLGRLDMDVTDLDTVVRSILKDNPDSTVGVVGDSYGARVALEFYRQLMEGKVKGKLDYMFFSSPFLDIDSFNPRKKISEFEKGELRKALRDKDLKKLIGEKNLYNLGRMAAKFKKSFAVPYGKNADNIQTRIMINNVRTWIETPLPSYIGIPFNVLIAERDQRINVARALSYFAEIAQAKDDLPFQEASVPCIEFVKGQGHNMRPEDVAGKAYEFIRPYLK